MNPDYFRKQGAMLLAWARESFDSATADRLRLKAQEFLDKAADLDVPQPVAQQQQQQQYKAPTNGKPTVLVGTSPTGGFRWRVILDGETVGSGDAATEFEAREAANEIIERIEAKPPEGP